MIQDELKAVLSWNYNLPNLTDAQFAEMGRIINRWAYLEEHINTAISLSLRLDTRQGLALTSPIRNFRHRLDALYGIWEYSDKNAAALLKPICKEILRLYAVRNAIAHRPWWMSKEDNVYSFNLSPKNLPFHPAEEMTVNELKKASEDIANVNGRLQEFIEEHRTIIASLQNRFPIE